MELRNETANGRQVIFEYLEDEHLTACTFAYAGDEDLWDRTQAYVYLPRNFTDDEISQALQVLLECCEDEIWDKLDLLEFDELDLEAS